MRGCCTSRFPKAENRRPKADSVRDQCDEVFLRNFLPVPGNAGGSHLLLWRMNTPIHSLNRQSILFVSPASWRYDATLHYYQAEFSAVVSHLRNQFPSHDIEAIPSGLTGAPQRVSVEKFLDEPELIIFWCRVWEAPAVIRAAREAKAICPEAKIVVWGDAVHFMPHYFQRTPFDGYVASGDPEAVLSDLVRAFAAGSTEAPGLASASNAWRPSIGGRLLDPSEWPFPALDVIDFADYRQAREFRGKPTDDLSFYVSRGCAVGCEWCSAPLKEGSKDRRRPAQQTVDYMRHALGDFDLFQMHSAMFMQDRLWCAEFVAAMRRHDLHIPFKIVTLQRHLEDAAIVGDLASVGLRSVGFGIETLTADKSRLRLTAKVAEERLDLVQRNLSRAGVQGKAYVQLGLPGQSRQDVLHTCEVLLRLGFKIRATGATPFHTLRGLTLAQLENLELERWDRKSFYRPDCGLTPYEFHKLLNDPEGFVSVPEMVAAETV